MTRYVFSLGLIPVQEWIAEARRSRDLKAGSAFLAFVMGRILASVEKEGEVWLPAPPERGFQQTAPASFAEGLEKGYGIPNRSTGMLHETSPERAQGLLGSLQKDVVERAWAELRRSALEGDLSWLFPSEASEVKDLLQPHVRRYLEQVPASDDCPLSLVWVAAPLAPGDEAGVRREGLDRIDRLYSEVKLTRPVRPWRHGAPVGKCNQCGKREALGPQERFDTWRAWSRELARQPWIERGVRIDPGERLCPVCLVKRIASYPQGDRTRFPSTGEIAVKPWLEQVREVLPEEFRQVASTDLGRDDLGRALLDSDARLRKAEEGATVEARKALFAAVRTLPKQPGREISPHPPSYLALLAFDGDSMGQRVREAPESIPAQLETFAERAGTLLRGAAVFYLAGDEGLAMAPAATALDLILELNKVFRETVSGATLSMGVAFFEYSRPMKGAIEAAREALRKAKALEGKDALGVAVETASGNRWGFTAHWGEDWDRVRNAVRLVQNRKLSAGWAHDVESFLESLPPADSNQWSPPLMDASREEVKRLFFRRLLKVPGKTPEEKLAYRRQVWAGLPGETWWPLNDRGQVERLRPEQLHLIAFLSRQEASGAVAGAED